MARVIRKARRSWATQIRIPTKSEDTTNVAHVAPDTMLFDTFRVEQLFRYSEALTSEPFFVLFLLFSLFRREGVRKNGICSVSQTKRGPAYFSCLIGVILPKMCYLMTQKSEITEGAGARGVSTLVSAKSARLISRLPFQIKIKAKSTTKS